MELTDPCLYSPFSALCTSFQQIYSTTKKADKATLVKHLYTTWKQKRQNQKESFYNILRLIIPKLDTDRKSYNLKEKNLADKFCKVLCLSAISNEGKRLKNFKSIKGTKDFPDALHHVLKDRCHGVRGFTVREVNDMLDSIQAGTKDHPGQVKMVLEQITQEMRPSEIKWFIRLVLKDLNLGMSDKSVLQCLEQGAQPAYLLCSNLQELCSKLETLDTLTCSVKLNQVFKPMVADRITDLSNAVQCLDNEPFFVETKYDGERIQIHKDGSNYLYFSRGLLEYSTTYGATPLCGSFTPRLHPTLDAHTCVLDGEIMVYDELNKLIITKADGQDARNLKPNYPLKPCVILYDILYYNGAGLISTPLKERRRLLERVVKETVGVTYLSQLKIRSTNEQVLSDLNSAIEHEEEGIVLKKPSSLYVPDGRVDSGWFKVKPDYLEQLSDTLDVVILGGYYGKGRGSGKICHFLCGLATGKGSYSSFCKVSSGLTDNDLKDKIDRLTPYWIPFDKLKIPKEITLGTNAREKPAYLIQPQHSLILEIRAAELMATSFFALPYTTRFTRVVRVREDKGVEDCTTQQEVEKLQKVSKRGIGKITSLKPSPNKRLKLASPAKVLTVKSRALADRVYCVLSGSDNMSKGEGEQVILEHGGQVVQTPLPHCTVVYGRESISVKNIITNAQHVMLDMHWLYLCQVKPITCPPHLIKHCPPSLQEEMLSSFDRWGDSYIDDVTADTLRHQFSLMSTKEMKKMLPETRQHIVKRYLGNGWRHVLDGWVILFEEQGALQLLVELHGGRVVLEGSESVTHVLNSATKEELVEKLKPYLDEEVLKEFMK